METQDEEQFIFELDLLEGSLWTVVSLEAMLVSVVHAAAPGHGGAWSPHEHIWSVPPTDALVMSSDLAASGAMLMWVACT